MGSWLSLSTLLCLLTAYYIGHMINTFYKIYSVPACKEGLPCGKPFFALQKDGKFPVIQFRVYATEQSLSMGKVVKVVDDFQLADAQELKLNFTLPPATRRNGTLFLVFLYLPKDTPEDVDYRRAKWYVIQKAQVSAYREPERTFNLMTGEVKEKLPPVTHIRSVVNIMSFEDSPEISLRDAPEIQLFGDENGYYPMLYVADLLSREKDLVELKKDELSASITISYQPVPVGKIRFHRMISASLQQLLQLGFTQKDLEDVKAIFGDTNLYLLGVTVFVSTIHLLFDVLSFKNDIAFWRSRESMVGLSSKALLWRCFSYTIIFFYLKDQQTSLLVIIPAGISVLIEFWKLKKAFKVSFSWQGLKFGAHSAEEAETDAFDNEAMKYLAWLMTPLCIGGAVYSLMYVPHKSWYSWVLESLANGVYAFGFLFMLPQLFVNYKLKSVAHLPWRAFTYKAFNTFIDDLFAFIIVMPTSHRVACFRDDIVFMIYLYQRYLYPVDHSRVNEFGQKGKDEDADQTAVEKHSEAAAAAPGAEKARTRRKGVRLEDVVVQRKSLVSSLAWHPSEILIAVAWTDGVLMMLSPEANIEFNAEEEMRSKVKYLQWSGDGESLWAVLEDGKCNVYKLITKSSVKKSGEYDVGDKPTAACRIVSTSPIGRPSDDGEDSEAPGSTILKSDMLSTRRNSVHIVSSSTSSIVVGTEGGVLHMIERHGSGVRLGQLDYRVEFLAHCDQNSLLIALTSDMMLFHLNIMADSTIVEKLKVKLSGKPGCHSILLKENVLLISHQERDLRVWDLETEENGTVSLQPSKGFDADDVILCADYSKRKGIISAGTMKGKVANWKRRAGETSVENTWRLQTGNQLAGKITSLEWSPMYSALAVNTDGELTILQEENSIVCLRNKIAAIQTGPSSFTLINVTSAVHQDLKLNFHVKGIFIQEKQLVVWSDDTVMTFDVQSSLATMHSHSFSCRTEDVVIYNQTLYCIEGDKINVRTLQGTIRQILSLPEMEGDPVQFSANRNWLAVATSAGFLRIYNIGGKEARQEYHSKYIVEALDNFHRFICMKMNVAGNRIACTYLATPLKIGDSIVVWDAEGDLIVHFSFPLGMTDQQQYEAEAELASSHGRPVTAAARKMEREQSRFRLPMHDPGPLFWDDADDRFLVCHAQASSQHVVDDVILTMFVTSDHGIQMQDLSRKSHASEVLVGVSVPHLYFTKKMEFEEEEVRGEKSIGRYLIARSLREFSGVENCDESTRKGMMDFCYYLTIGQMDEAFKAIRFIKSESVWEHMASMSVKTRRLDVAVVCLGNMRNVRGARALRKSQEAGDSEALQCAALAVELGMLDEAEAIYVSEDRYDMVNKIHQAQNAWNQAFEVASRHDRIHLRNTHYNYAKYLERAGALEPAIDNFEKSGTHHFEVPRMFADSPKILEGYVRRKKEPELHAWWARYLESIGELDGAMSFYSAAKDIMSLVRIKCTQGHVDEATTLALETKDRAACYHLARIYENEENYAKAVDFYTRAHAYNSAIRLVKEHDMKDLLANLCLMAGGSEIVEAARYFEDIPGYTHQAVMLYHKAGMIGRALDLAFRTEQFSALDLVTKDLNASCDSNVLKRAAEFFANNQNYEKAVELLCMAKEFNEAIEVCRSRNVRLTDKVSELMTPTKETTPNDEERKRLLENIAELGVQQGNYHFAAKKFTQAGDKLQAMRALLKSGDTQKIVFFANTARNKDIYILAANYLQTTDWQGNAQVIREIETFYTKAHAHLHLASFYKACAYMEVETFNDFSKAAEALEHALRTIERGLEANAATKETSSSELAGLTALKEEIIGQLARLAKFEKIKEVYAADENDAVLQLQALVEHASEDSIIRPSHIYALLIAHHAGKQNYRPAYRCITQLQKLQKNLDLATVIDAELLDKICDELQVARVTNVKQQHGDSDNEVEDVEYSHAMKKRESLF